MPQPPAPARPETTRARRLRTWGIDLLQTAVGFVLGLILELDASAVVHPRLTRVWANVSVWVTLFWPLVLAFLGLFWWRHALNARYEIRTRAAWLHPVSVWNGLQRNIRDSLIRGVKLRSRRGLSDAQRAELLRDEVRLLLSEVLALAEGVEPRRPGRRYAVNVMRRYYPADLGGAFGARVRNAVVLDPAPGAGWHGVGSVLFLDHRLSTASAKGSGQIDPLAGDFTFVLPAPAMLPTGQRAILPGAPVAATDGAVIGLTAGELLALCRSADYACDLSGVARLEQYLASPAGQAVRSFVSFPVALDDGDDIVAVLNVHSNGEDLLRDEDLRDLLYYLLRPLSLTLLSLLESLDGYERRAGEVP